jgi:hypothetical protein
VLVCAGGVAQWLKWHHFLFAFSLVLHQFFRSQVGQVRHQPDGIASEIAKSALFGAAKFPTVATKAFLLSDICINYTVGRRERRGSQKCNKNPSIPPPSFATSTNGWRFLFRLGNQATAVIRPNLLIKRSSKCREAGTCTEH